MTCKIRVKVGLVEVDYEGTEEFVKNELGTLLQTISELQNTLQIVTQDVQSPVTGTGNADDYESARPEKIQGTTGTLAARLRVKSGPDLVIAAAARLTFGLGQETFKRDDILQEMKTANSYYKQSYSSNLTKTLERLVKSGQLIEPSTGLYAIQASERRRLEMTLVG